MVGEQGPHLNEMVGEVSLRRLHLSLKGQSQEHVSAEHSRQGDQWCKGPEVGSSLACLETERRPGASEQEGGEWDRMRTDG